MRASAWIGIHQRVERLLDHGLRLGGHRAKVAGQINPFALREKQHPFGDVLGQVAHPLQIVIDLQHGHDEAQVGRHRLIEGQRLEHLLFDVDFHAVDFGVLVDNGPGEIAVAVDQGRDAFGQRFFHERPDEQNLLFEALDLPLQVNCHDKRETSSRASRQRMPPRCRCHGLSQGSGEPGGKPDTPCRID